MTRSLLVLLLAAAPAPAHAQLLGRASDAVRGTSDDSRDSSDDDDYGSSDDDDYDSGQDDGGGSLLGSASRAVRGGGRTGGGRPRAPARDYVFGACPYAAGASGYLAPARAPDGELREGRLAARVEAELGYALGGAGRGGLGARLSLPFLLDFATRYSVFLEPTEGGVAAAALGRIGIDLRVVDLPALQIRLGGGLRHWHDAYGGMLGADAQIGFDAYPGEPVILSGEFGAGAVGEAIVLQARGSIGFIIDATEIYAGYHYEGLIAGGQHVDLGGPMLGARIWL